MIAVRRVATALVLLAAVVAAAATTAHRLNGVRETGRLLPITAATLVCPDVSGSQQTSTRMTIADPSGGSAANVRISQLQGEATTSRPVTVSPGFTETVTRAGGPVAVIASGADAAAIAAAQTSLTDSTKGRGLTAANCERPRTDWWFVGANGGVGYQDTLWIANPLVTAATVHITLLSSRPTPVTAPKLASIEVPGHSAVSFPMASVAPDVPNIALHVHASLGLVTAAVDDVQLTGITPAGRDWIPAASPPGEAMTIPGLTPGPGDKSVEVANPGQTAAVVHLEVVSDTGSFAPKGHDEVDVPAGESTVIDLTGALDGHPGAVIVMSNEPVVASALTSMTAGNQLPDLVWRTAVDPLAVGDTWAQGWTRQGRSDLLTLTAPDQAATVTVQAQSGRAATLTVPAGRLTTVDLAKTLHASPHGPGFATVTAVSGGPVYAVQTIEMAGARGPLVAGLPPSRPLAAVRLPAIVSSPGTALTPAVG